MPLFSPFSLADVELRDPELLQKREADRVYLLKLTTDNLLRPYRLEAGLWSEAARPEGIHWGWESPSSQLRGHFLGHWLSAASIYAAATGDREMLGKAEAVIDGLEKCQEANGGEWLGSIPEKYLERIAAGKWVWAPHYTVHKTFMGLMDAHRYIGSRKALALAENWAKWFHRWSSTFSLEEMDEIMDFETGGMLEIWAELYGITGKREYRELMDRYSHRRLFAPLLEGSDPLTNMHANTTVPEIIGAARAYEVTGEGRWLDIVKAYWEIAVERLPRYATGGSTAGEIWVPEGRLPHRLGDKNQELCTVYNLMRLAEFLLRETGEPRYADYWERNLRNGVMAQGFWQGRLTTGAVADHPLAGLVSYFLPMRPGSVKLWASETEHFFCCHGTNVQANAAHTKGIFYESRGELEICQLIESVLTWRRAEGDALVEIRRADLAGHMTRIDGTGPANPCPPDRLAFDISVRCASAAKFAISLRLPWWLSGEARLFVNGAEERIESRPSSFIRVERAWKEDRLRLELPKRLSSELLPGSSDSYAFMDGPDLLAGLCDEERSIYCDDPKAPEGNLVSDNEREWSTWTQGYKTRGQDRGIRFIPIRDVGYERYSIYFPVAPAVRRDR
jgi:Uncharacterized protein conserved in bacteria